jgi:TATA-box binding protein (TBP) (component of TFIID and TFIIIB)
MNFVEETNKKLKLGKLPSDINISTLTLTCGWDTDMYVKNIWKYIKFNDEGIIQTECLGNIRTIRTIIIKNNKKEKSKKGVYNQISIIVKIPNENKFINIKIFTNGSLQITGCKDINNFYIAMNIFITELRKDLYTLNLKTKKIKKIKFVENLDEIKLENINDIPVRMINSNFKVPFKIDRYKIYKLLNDNNIVAELECCIHPCVDVIYKYDEDTTISMYIFESGAINITGAKTTDHIYQTYKFIVNFLYSNYKNLVRLNFEDFLEYDEIIHLIRT